MLHIFKERKAELLNKHKPQIKIIEVINIQLCDINTRFLIKLI